ncbi:MAG: hypothetical protein ACYCOU_00150 [Sulfobacillus sp.]
MGSIAGSIFDLVGGNPAQTEQNQFGGLATYGTKTGEGATTAANNYYYGILSGNPEEIAQTLAPEISAGQQQVQQQAQTNAEFGNRGGGTNSSTQAAKSQERGNIINLIGGAQQGAAAGEAGLGSNMLSQASGNLGQEAQLATNWRNQQVNDVNGIAQGVASIATGLPMGAVSDPYSSLYAAQNPSSMSTLEPTTSSLSTMIQ